MARNWNGPNEWREVVQIGAIRVDGSDEFRELAAFERLVRPKRNPVLSNYFTKLTGITQDRLDCNGVDFVCALDAFEDFVGAAPALSNGGDEEILFENCDLLNMPRKMRGTTFVNVRPALAISIGRPESLVNSGMLVRLFDGAPASLVEHDALSDARAIAFALRNIVQFQHVRR
jgi:inhibitor of KinA sporulation pathway (predicted exonuclease)